MDEYIELKQYVEAQMSFMSNPESDFFRGVREGFNLVKVYLDKRIEAVKESENHG